MNDYVLTVSESQARVLSLACELAARIGIGQWREILEWLPIKHNLDEAERRTIDAILSKHMVHGIDGWSQSLSINSPDTDEQARRAWDLYQVIRHRLAWDRAITEGIVKPGEPRNWSKMMGVHYDEPMRTAPEMLAKMESKP